MLNDSRATAPQQDKQGNTEAPMVAVTERFHRLAREAAILAGQTRQIHDWVRSRTPAPTCSDPNRR